MNAFPSTSRYHTTEVKTLTLPTGEPISYVGRRLVPPPERFALLQEHTVKEGDRLDNLTAQYFGDPEKFWCICDANGVLRPNELVEAIGSKIRITLPEGIPGPGVADA